MPGTVRNQLVLVENQFKFLQRIPVAIHRALGLSEPLFQKGLRDRLGAKLVDARLIVERD